MEWISVKDQKPPSKDILILNRMGCIHRVVYDYDEYCLPETCDGSSGHTPGQAMHFDFWMDLPEIAMELVHQRKNET